MLDLVFLDLSLVDHIDQPVNLIDQRVELLRDRIEFLELRDPQRAEEGAKTGPGRPRSPMMAPLAPDVIYAKEWLARFRSLFDQEAADPRTALGLFYERHRRFVPVAGAVAPSRPEYTYEEWNRTFTAFLASLARDFGLVQTASWSDVPQLMWLWHGLPDRPAVAIREVKVAGEAIVREEVPSVVK